MVNNNPKIDIPESDDELPGEWRDVSEDTCIGQLYDPPDREECDRCNGLGVITERLDGPDWCPDCNGSGYADGWPEHVRRERDPDNSGMG